MDKSYRIHTNITSDTLLQVNMRQDFDFLEILSLKLKQKDAYRIHSSNYGVIVGRVLANDAFGVPNAKISVFVERDPNDPTDMESLYPYIENTTKDKEGRRYNLLPDYSHDDCYRIVGTFPNKRLMLDDGVQLEVYDKYYKYTTVTNNAGDYMLFGVPADTLQIHVDIDLSDIGVLSQKPRDFEYKGYNVTEFDSPSQFKESTNLDGLAQIFSQNKSVSVYPFWGDPNNGIACITRSDIQIDYKFEPTCVFMGSIVSDNNGNAIGHRCAPDINNGMNDQLVGGNGTIEMIRKTTDGLVEEFQIQGNQLIDENGVWCYQIPMNLDYVGTDEYGNIVPTDNPNKGIPTRTQVRFRISKNETEDEGFSRHTAKYLVPMNPIFSEEENNIVKKEKGTENAKGAIPVINSRGSDIEQMYVFGSGTPEHCFRDLYWNNVYSVKNYIPKTQISTRAYSNNNCALKGTNLVTDQNPIPFNKLRVDIPFSYIIICILFTMVMSIIAVVNGVFSAINVPFGVINDIRDWTLVEILGVKIKPFSIFPKMPVLKCIPLSAGLSEGNIAYYPGCFEKHGLEASDCPEDMEGECVRVNDNSSLKDQVQRNLALDYKIVKLDFYQDWLNGCLYAPLWYWRKRKKKKFLFITLSPAKNEYCDESKAIYKRLRTYVTCNIRYRDTSFTTVNNKYSMPDSEKRWHKNRKGRINYLRGLIKPVENRDGLTVYYYTALEATTDNVNPKNEMADRGNNFKAVRLFATDIILLGNLNQENIYGIPQFFKCLPPTTANVPPIASIQEDNDAEDENDTDNEIKSSSADAGTRIITGMDWGHDGDEDSPMYSSGLFMDLACTYVNTKPKACINVERLSELGVNTDMTYTTQYHNGGKLSEGTFLADGFVTKLELDDMENRAMFATLNHIGFIPQSYQDSIDAYSTQVQDTNTGYYVPKFKYIYPVDFDGRLQSSMTLYKNGFKQAMYDETDQSYITFRLGAEESSKKEQNSEGRIRHFYFYDGSYYDMPLYNNSFYFYFGIKKGATAIDKFNQLFYSPCFKNTKEPFSLVITKRGKAYCPDVYGKNSDGVDNKSVNAYGWIRIKSDDIRTPYTYRLYDGNGNEIVSESGMTKTDFVIGGYVNDNGDVISNDDVIEGRTEYGYIHLQMTDVLVEPKARIENEQYILEVIDSEGKKITEKINVSRPKISADYVTTKLGTKFYSSASTRIDYICSDDTAFYGKIEMTSFSIDGYDCTINNVSLVTKNDDKYIFKIEGECEEYINKTVYALLEVTVDSSEVEHNIKNCLCDKENDISKNTANMAMYIDEAKDYGQFFVSGKDNKVTLFLYQPNTYKMMITQSDSEGAMCCEGCNSTTDLVTVANGEPFMTYLNGMPTRFMLGTTNDNSAATIANTSHFYNSSGAKATTNSGIIGWYGLHQEDTYMFSKEENKTYLANQKLWKDVLPSLTDDITTPAMKRLALKFKFDKMFSLCNGAYVNEASSKKFTFETTGGVSPILYRTVAPMYGDAKVSNTYILNDYWSTTCNDFEANIVGSNYSKAKENWNNVSPDKRTLNIPQFNGLFGNDKDKVGNYFAAFTRDGGYISNDKIDGNIKIERSPSFTSISPAGSKPKVKGKDVEGNIATFKLAFEKGKQKLTGDIERNTLPYLRGMYVDRRIDYDLVFLGPAVGSNFNLYDDSDGRNRIWKSGRISGWTYNGIEMSYDEEYNVISANTLSGVIDGDLQYSAATFNNRLEYTYRYDTAHKCMSCGTMFSENRNTCPNPLCGEDNIAYFHGERAIRDENDAITLYNKWNENNNEDCVWGSWNNISVIAPNENDENEYSIKNFGYDEKEENKNKPLFKEFYASSICGMDIRHLYWSSFNRNRLNKYITGGSDNGQIDGKGENGIKNVLNPLYVYQYPYDKTGWYNGDFNRVDATTITDAKAYPTKRFIDIGNLPMIPSYSFNIQSCSYDMKSTIEDDGTIKAITDSGENFDLGLEFNPPIVFETPSNASSSYANVTYKPDKAKSNSERIVFNSSSVSVRFRFNSYSHNDFDVYTRTPRLIRVLPYINGIDGIGYFKTANEESEFTDERNVKHYGDGKTLDDALSTITLHNGVFTKKYIEFPSGVKHSSGFTTTRGLKVQKHDEIQFFKKNGTWLKSNDEDFTNLVFTKTNTTLQCSDGKYASAFAILVDREFQYKNDDYLIKHVRVIETSEVIDCRKVELGIVPSGSGTGTTEDGETIDYNNDGTYVTMLLSSSQKSDVLTDVTLTPGASEGDDPSLTPTTGTVEDSTRLYSQTITFCMYLDNNSSTDVGERNNSSLTNYEMLSYTFKFWNNNGVAYEIVPSEVKRNNTEVRFVCKWSSDMGILADSQWSGNPVPCQLLIKTTSGFIYKLTNFAINLPNGINSQLPAGNDLSEKKKAMTSGQKYYTTINFII